MAKPSNLQKDTALFSILLHRLKALFIRPAINNVAILGIDYAEYQLAQILEAEHNFRVVIFIDENPWNYRNKIGAGEIRSLSDLAALCAKHQVSTVFYCDPAWLPKIARLKLPAVKYAGV